MLELLQLLLLPACILAPEQEPDGSLLPVVVVAPPGPAVTIESVPVYGGTLETVPALDALVAADPSGDRLLRIAGDDVFALDLGLNARPFRLAVDGTNVWATLRGTGELVQVDLVALSVTWRVHVCAEPRGVARSPAGPLVVACADGPLVEVDDNGAIVRSILLEPDLRDVVPSGGVLFVSRFASAEVLGLDPVTLHVLSRGPVSAQGRVAWRMRATENGDVLVLHELVPVDPVVLPEELDTGITPPEVDAPTGYSAGPSGPGCDSVHASTFAVLSPRNVDASGFAAITLPGPSLAEFLVTDFVVTPDREVVAAVTGAPDGRGKVVSYPNMERVTGQGRTCTFGFALSLGTATGRASAVAVDSQGRIVVQTAGPTAILRIDGEDVSTLLSTNFSTEDLAVRDFHRAAPLSGVACASCHPEGGDDGNVWQFVHTAGSDTTLPRRTMSLAGDLLGRQPYHWDGALADPEALMTDTFTNRMEGGVMPAEDTVRLFEWLEGLRPVRANAARTAEVVDRGRTLFTETGCADCHAGPAFTDDLLHEVRLTPDGPVKTPSLLGVGSRGHLFHDGCAATLEDRFTPPCDDGFDRHGRLSALDAADIDALTAYVRTL